MTQRQARRIARLYIGKIAQQDDAFFVPGLSYEDSLRVELEIKEIGFRMLGIDLDVGDEQHLIIERVLGFPVEGQR